MKPEINPLPLPPTLAREIRRTARATGLSLAEVVRQSLRLGLRQLREQLGADRVTNVEPLSNQLLGTLYLARDDEGEGLAAFVNAQSFEAD